MCVYVYVYVCACVCMYVCVRGVCMCVCVVCVWVYVYMYTWVHGCTDRLGGTGRQVDTAQHYSGVWHLSSLAHA